MELSMKVGLTALVTMSTAETLILSAFAYLHWFLHCWMACSLGIACLVALRHNNSKVDDRDTNSTNNIERPAMTQ